MKPVGAAARTIAILTHLAKAHEPLRLVDISAALGLNPSTCLGLLRTLAHYGWATHDRDTRRYGIGPRLIGLGRSPSDAIPGVLERLAILAVEFNTHMALWRRDKTGHLVLTAAFEGPGDARLSLTIGQRRPLLLGAMGRVMAAFGGLERSAIETGFARLRWHRPPLLDGYMREVAQARRRGWADDDGGAIAGLHTVAAPVFGAGRTVGHVCCATMFAGQHDRRRQVAIAERLKQIGEHEI